MEWVEFAGYGMGLVIGAILGLLGGGGSVLIMPVLVYLFHILPAEATAYSLFVVGCGALMGTYGSLKRNEVDWKTGGLFALPSMLAVYTVQRWGLPAIPETWSMGYFEMHKDTLIMGTFAVLMIAAAYSMLKQQSDLKQTSFGSSLWWIIAIEGLVVGAITGFVGAGGGFLIVPVLVVLLGMSMEVAVGTSLLIISIKSLVGFFGSMGNGAEVDWMLILPFMALTVVGTHVGTLMRDHVKGATLKRLFGWFILLMGVVILLTELN
jgi:uncharacterized membrane protein YfcA